LKRKSTITDIAARVGITPSAVSKAFSNHPRISSETKRKVLEAAGELGYKPNSLATGLRKGRSGLIGVVVPGIHYSFFSTAIKGVEEIITDHGYNVVIVQTRDSEELELRQLDGLMKARVEGIVASLAMHTKSYKAYLDISKDIPVVLFDRTFSHEGINEVTVNDFAGAVAAVQHLITMGYKRIAHLAGFEHVRPFAQRIEGYRFALNKAGMVFRKDYIAQCAPNSDAGEAAMVHFLSLDEPPDAIFAASDYLAYGAMQAVLKRGMNVPHDVGIVGFSNEAFTQQVTPSISTVDQYSEELGSSAATILLEHLKAIGDEQPFIIQRKIIEPKLIIRQSSLRANPLVK
jgi:LacI family transcriptional regulator